jgi:glycosyltransferase involved in cell wall biosynthesis
VLRNLPLKKEVAHSLNLENKTILYQGAVNMNRGVEELVLAMQHVDNATLMIVGNGDVFPLVQELVIQHKLTDKIQLLGQVPFEKLDELTKKATIGVSLEKGDAMSYHYALPNKLFDYIKNGIPILASELPEITKLIQHYDIGQAIKTISSEEIALSIKKLLSDDQLLLHYSDNCKKAHLELTWENEKKVVYATLNPGSQ